MNPVDAPAPGLQWNPYDAIVEDSLQKQQKIYGDYNRCLQTEPNKFEEIEKFTDILNCISDPKIRKTLSETMQNINPSQLLISNTTRSRFFVIKSYSEDDLHRAIKYGVWCSTKTGNTKLDIAYRELNKVLSPNQEPGRLFLFFSVNGSGFFAGIAEMTSCVNVDENCGFWSQNKWVGKFKIKWHYVKDVRNSNLRHIRSEANENKPVTNSRDAVEVTPSDNGFEFIKVFHYAKFETSVFDDFEHYERREHDPTLSEFSLGWRFDDDFGGLGFEDIGLCLDVVGQVLGGYLHVLLVLGYETFDQYRTDYSK